MSSHYTAKVARVAIEEKENGMRARFKQLSAVLAGLAALVFAVLPSRADEVFSNLGPGGAFDAGVAYSINGPDIVPFFPVSDIDIASPFTIGGADYRFDSAQLALQYVQGTNVLSLYLMDNAPGNLPGNVLQAITLTDIPASPTLITAHATGLLTLRANTTYWLAASADTDTLMTWYLNATGDTGFAERSDNGAWFADPNAAAPAFRVNASIPEPGTLALAASGLLPLAGAVRRRKRQVQQA